MRDKNPSYDIPGDGRNPIPTPARRPPLAIKAMFFLGALQPLGTVLCVARWVVAAIQYIAVALERLLGEQAVDVVGLDVAALREHGSDTGAAGVRGERSGGDAGGARRGGDAGRGGHVGRAALRAAARASR